MLFLLSKLPRRPVAHPFRGEAFHNICDTLLLFLLASLCELCVTVPLSSSPGSSSISPKSNTLAPPPRAQPFPPLLPLPGVPQSDFPASPRLSPAHQAAAPQSRAVASVHQISAPRPRIPG